jgi:hypothetical protein
MVWFTLLIPGTWFSPLYRGHLQAIYYLLTEKLINPVNTDTKQQPKLLTERLSKQNS